MAKPHLLLELLEEARPGRCVICDEPMAPRKSGGWPKRACSAACRRVYESLYSAAHYQAARKPGKPRREVAP